MPINATCTMRDSYGRITTKRVETAYEDLDDAQAQIAAYVSDLDEVTDLQLLYVTYSLKDDDESFAGEAGSNVDVGATFQVLTEAGKRAAHKVPGFPASLVGGLGAIDVTQGAVVAYFANFQDPQGCLLSDGEQVAEVLSGTLDR